MSGSQNPKQEDVAETPELQKTCDYCGDLVALLYCTVDSAKLCFFCDRKVHFPNQLFSKHTRSLLCDACGDSPSSLLCFTEDSVLCHNCDCKRHNDSLPRVHQRRALEGFSGCPSVNELLKILGLGEKSSLSIQASSHIEGLSDLYVWNGSSVVGLQDLITSTASSHKNHKGQCGRQKDEIRSQLCELIKLEDDLIHGEIGAERHGQFGNFSTGFERDVGVNMVPSYEGSVFCWHGENSDPTNQIVPSDTSLTDYSEVVLAKDPSFRIPGSHANFYNQGKPSNSFKTENLSPTPKPTPYELTSHERDSALLRYREKKKNRRYDKYIRYESRKVRAQSRMRIKGRFVKDETQK